MAQNLLTATFQLMGDDFAHAWYFNRFRCDPIGGSVLVTTALVSDTGGTPVVNGFVISKRDLEAAKERSLEYLGGLSAAIETDADDAATTLLFSASPTRVYPINTINLSRMDDVAEITLYRYSMHTFLNVTKPASKTADKGSEKSMTVIPCYPVVMFRCEVSVQLALLKELFSA